MRAFIIRPFGTKEGIDFDRVERELLEPALDQLRISGRTTGEVIRQGNIRSDMFLKLLAADLVIADLSIHNANVFYELGIRHALRDRSTFLIKSTSDIVPFDLLTDRYFVYDAENPGAQVDDLVAALDATLASLVRDSPVFQQLPSLPSTQLESIHIAPFDFTEEVERAESRGARGKLQLIAEEVAGFDWNLEGLRCVGRAQCRIGDHAAARSTWERAQQLVPMDPEANTLLATIYERLGELDRSDQVLRRIINHGELSSSELTEARSLLGRNAKTRWQQDWQACTSEADRREAALRSPHLQSSLDGYENGCRTDRNSLYAALNALTQAVILHELASVMPGIWGERFETEEEAGRKLGELARLRDQLAVAAELAIESQQERDRRKGGDFGWSKISSARLALTRSNNPRRVAHLFGAALAGAPEYARESSRKQLEMLCDLGVVVDNAKAAIEAIDRLSISPSAPPKRRTTSSSSPAIVSTHLAGHSRGSPARAKRSHRR